MRLLVLFLLLICITGFGQIQFKKALLLDPFSNFSLQAQHATLLPNGNYALLCRLDTNNSGLFYGQVVILDPGGNTLFAQGLSAGGIYPSGIVTTSDGGFLICVTELNFIWPSGDIIIAKYSDQGVMQWQRSYCAPEYQQARDIIATSDGGFLIAAITQDSSNSDVDHLLIKLDSAGGEIWSRIIMNPNPQSNGKLKELPNGDIVYAGESMYEIVIYRLSASGNIIWSNRFGHSNTIFLSAIETYSSDIILCGVSVGLFINPGFVARVSANGNMVWAREIGDVFSGTGMPVSMVRTPDQKFVITGSQGDTSIGGFCPFVKKFDAFGNGEWHVFHGFGNGTRVSGMDIVMNPDSTFFVSCSEIGMVFRTNQQGSSGCMETNTPIPLQPVTFTSTPFPVNVAALPFTNTSTLYQAPPNLQELWFCTNSTSATTIS